MTIILTPPEFKRLTSIVQDLPEFVGSKERRRLVQGALAGVTRANMMLGRIDFDGTPMGVATEVIRFLMSFGQIAPGQEALGVFLDYVLVNTGGGDDADFMADLVTHYNLRAPILSLTPIFSTPAPVPDVPLPSAAADYVFISYAHADHLIAEQVERALNASGVRVFRDASDIRSGANWDMIIEKALSDATHMILLLSAVSMPYRKEVYREWFYFDQQRKPLIPLYIQDCTLHSRMIAYNYIDARHDLLTALNQVVQTLARPVQR